MTVCACGPKLIVMESSGGIRIGGMNDFEPLPLKGTGGVKVGGNSFMVIPQQLAEDHAFLLHLQEEDSPYQNEGTGGDGNTNESNERFNPTQEERGLFGGYSQRFNEQESIEFEPFSDDELNEIDTSVPFVLSAWVKIDSFHKQRYLFSFGENRLWHNVLNQFQFTTLFPGDENTTFATTESMQINDCWHYVAVRYIPAKSIEVFVDGVNEQTIEINQNLPVQSNSDRPMIGRDWIKGGNFKGNIQELRLRYGTSSDGRVEYEYLNGCHAGFFDVSQWETP